MKKKHLYIMCGAPGAGKTTWVRENAEPGTSAHISRDRIRFEMLKENDSYFKHEQAVYNEFIEEIARALDDCPWITEVYADATHMTTKSRKKLLNSLFIRERENVVVTPIIIMPYIETCIERNNRRQGRARVPETVIEKMYMSFEDPEKDGFDYEKILYFND